MGYVEKNLTPGEEILLRPKYHSVRFATGAALVLFGVLVFVSAFLLSGLSGTAGIFGTKTLLGFPASGLLLWIGLVLILAGAARMLWRAFIDSFDEFALTSLRVIKKTGFVTRTVRQIPLDKVQDVNIHATLGGRWLSYGDVELQTAGSDSTVIFPRIRAPEAFRNALFAHLPHAGGAPVVLAAPEKAAVEERLKEAERLLKKGVITKEEFEEKRKALIGEL